VGPDALYDDLDSRTLFNLNTVIQWIHTMAGNVRRGSECLTDLSNLARKSSGSSRL
jgi:hypothetical protein